MFACLLFIFLQSVPSLVGAVVLRAAVALFNHVWGGAIESSAKEAPQETESAIPQTLQSSVVGSADLKNPYAAPSVALSTVYTETRYVNGVQQPNFGAAFSICFITAVILTLAIYVLNIAILSSKIDPTFRSEILTWVMGGSIFGYFLLFSATVRTGLQTSFQKAIVIAGLYVLIFVLVAIVLLFLIAIGVYATYAFQR